MPLKNVHYQRLETEESDGEEDEAPPTHVELHSSHYVKGEARWGDSGLCLSPLNHSQLAHIVGVCVCWRGVEEVNFSLGHSAKGHAVTQGKREKGEGGR